MVHSFLITTYKDEEQLSSLVNQLKGKDSFIYIHIDRKRSEERRVGKECRL